MTLQQHCYYMYHCILLISRHTHLPHLQHLPKTRAALRTRLHIHPSPSTARERGIRGFTSSSNSIEKDESVGYTCKQHVKATTTRRKIPMSGLEQEDSAKDDTPSARTRSGRQCRNASTTELPELAAVNVAGYQIKAGILPCNCNEIDVTHSCLLETSAVIDRPIVIHVTCFRCSSRLSLRNTIIRDSRLSLPPVLRSTSYHISSHDRLQAFSQPTGPRGRCACVPPSLPPPHLTCRRTSQLTYL